MRTRLTSIDQLKPGVKIFRVDSCGFKWEILEFVCEHPHNNNLVIMVNDLNQLPIEVYKFKLMGDEWYLYDEHNSWAEIYAMMASMHKKEYEHYKELALDELKHPR